MDKLTDEELGRLLRETFAAKEHLVDTLPPAISTTRRPLAPVLLAAAAVLVVLGGILYGVNRDPDVAATGTATPASSPQPADEDAQIWAAAISAITVQFQPTYKVQVVAVPKRPASDAELGIIQPDATTSRTPSGAEGASIARPFSAAQMRLIATSVVSGTRAKVQWLTPDHAQICGPKQAQVSVGNVIDKGDHKEVRTLIYYRCSYAYEVTYRVEKQADTWVVAGSIGGNWSFVECGVKTPKPTTPPRSC